MKPTREAIGYMAHELISPGPTPRTAEATLLADGFLGGCRMGSGRLGSSRRRPPSVYFLCCFCEKRRVESEADAHLIAAAVEQHIDQSEGSGSWPPPDPRVA